MNGQRYSSFEELGKSMGVKGPYAPPNPASNPHQSAEKKEMPEFLKEGADYVAIAEKKILLLGQPDRGSRGKMYFRNFTTSKIRNILTLVNQLYNRIVLLRGDLPENIVSEIRYLKLRLIYEAGREQDVMKFCRVTGVIDAIDFIGNSKPRFLRYAKFMEALVAYHRFYGGRD